MCNAGLRIGSGTTYTQDGFEMTFGVNCLGHFLLVNLLLRSLVAPARIVFVSSTTHDPDRKKTFLSRLVGTASPRYGDARALAWPEHSPESEDQKESPRIVGMRRYSTSNLCDVLYAYELARRLQAEGYSSRSISSRSTLLTRDLRLAQGWRATLVLSGSSPGTYCYRACASPCRPCRAQTPLGKRSRASSSIPSWKASRASTLQGSTNEPLPRNRTISEKQRNSRRRAPKW